ncbi:hypothetical protein FVEN_g427 [Fusarium venenatum]|uniref:DUF4097 domain-containing protein n=1 Tax=Fusarium venenatum TaxID=56646 RepID=A0A2L2TST7_9HYPO|nr:uncharacterized protein FVRRES_07451 [Fusarium venenatum]KAG8362313.1 hypothetical protein FVEN_g427 [Fusarium venenatum]CEI63015.1 unnamed protein product [Fusarium venenatum]
MPAPYSDNLYSADSDDEPDALSPTDGYFHASSESSSSRSPHVPNVLVEDPTQLSRDAKAQEAERERMLLNTGGSSERQEHGGSTASLHERQERAAENPIAATPQPQPQSYSQRISMFAHSADAPPAYSPSPTSPNTVNNYQTFTSTATMGRPEETQPLVVHSHPPESMSDPSPNSSQPPSRWENFKDFIARLNVRRRLKTFLASLLIFSVVFMIFSSFTMHSSHGPGKSPARDKFTWHSSKSCPKEAHRLGKVFKELDIQPSRDLTIIQTVKDSRGREGWHTHISGELILRPTDKSSPAKIEAEVLSNTDGLGIDVLINETTQVVEVVVPRRIAWNETDTTPCIQVRATLWVSRGSVINTLTINTLQFDVIIDQGLVLGALDGVNIRSASGDINAPTIDATNTDKAVDPYTLSSREIYIHTASGDVRGWYPLYDLLDIGTASGDVTTGVGPKPVNPQAVRSATLKVRSASGTIKIDEPIMSARKAPRPDREFPPRDYRVDIITASGDVTADVAASSSASFKSQSGDLKLNIWPVLDSSLQMATGQDNPYLETDTKSGDTEVNLLEPLWTSLATIGSTIPPLEPYDPKSGRDPYIVLTENDETEAKARKSSFGVLQSKHKSISGTVKLVYPQSWEGILYAQSISGSQDFKGKDLKITHEGGTFMNIIRGRKGDKGYSSLEVNTVSGDQVVVIGEK